MTEFASGPVGETFKCTLAHIEREIGYLVRFGSNVRKLKANVELLTAKKDVVIGLIDAANMNDEVIRETVQTWLRHVENVLAAATKLNGKAALVDRWFKGWVLCSRFSTGRSGQKMNDLIQGLLENANAFGDTVADRRLVQNLLFSAEEFKAFGSRVTTAKQVIEALGRDDTSLFGVYGMPGVGKTNFISHLATHVKEQKIFDEVVVVTLTQTPEIKAIQDDIANGLGLKFEDADSLPTRASRLSQRLSHDRKTLIVFDNLWQTIQLSQVGIPQGVNNCKVVFTTRDADMCNTMGSGKSRIKVEILSPDESWDLFRENAGDTVDSPAFESVAKEVLNECQGLPLLIVTLGKALYGKDKAYWDAALYSLQTSIVLQDPVFADMPHVFYVMKWSYDHLKSEEIKLCFLLCCLFPDGYPISMDQLFHYMMGEKILRKASMLQAARLHLHTIIDKLISSCLLLKAKSGCIMMHDVVRDVALAIASDPSEGNGFIVKAGMELNDWPDMLLADCKRLSFITTKGNHMSWSLPNQIQAANLLTISFNGNEKLVEIPSEFFREVRSLTSLDLSYTGIEELPESIRCLLNLCTLLLEGCFRLKGVDVSNTRLEILSLRDSLIKSFVVSGKLTSLKLLDLSYTSNLEQIGRNIISSFVKLEELYLFDSFRAWEPEEKEYASSSEGREDEEEYASLSEVTSLTRLTSLEFHVGNRECLSQSIPNWENLTRFRIVVGVIENFSPFGVGDGLLLDKSMYIELGWEEVANWVIVLFGRTNFLQLKMGYRHRRLSNLSRQLDARPEYRIFQDLKVLVLSEIESGTSFIPCDLLLRLQNLNKLVVSNCNYLQELIGFGDASSSLRINTFEFSKMPRCSVFPNLRYLRVCACAELTFLFPMRVI